MLDRLRSGWGLAPRVIVAALIFGWGALGVIGNLDIVHALLDKKHPYWLVTAINTVVVPHPWDIVIVIVGIGTLVWAVVEMRRAQRTAKPIALPAMGKAGIQDLTIDGRYLTGSGPTIGVAGRENADIGLDRVGIKNFDRALDVSDHAKVRATDSEFSGRVHHKKKKHRKKRRKK